MFHYIVTLALLFALKGVGERAFYRWVQRDYHALFPRLPERTRLFRLFAAHQDWAEFFLADPTTLGVADTYGIECVIPGARTAPMGKLVGKTSPTIAGSWAQRRPISSTSMG